MSLSDSPLKFDILRSRDITLSIVLGFQKTANTNQLCFSLTVRYQLTSVELRFFDSFISLTATRKKLPSYFVFIHLHLNQIFDSFFSCTHKSDVLAQHFKVCWFTKHVEWNRKSKERGNSCEGVKRAMENYFTGRISFCTLKHDEDHRRKHHRQNCYGWEIFFPKNDLHTHACLQTMMMMFFFEVFNNVWNEMNFFYARENFHFSMHVQPRFCSTSNVRT